jgi:hypothetical protein
MLPNSCEARGMNFVTDQTGSILTTQSTLHRRVEIRHTPITDQVNTGIRISTLDTSTRVLTPLLSHTLVHTTSKGNIESAHPTSCQSNWRLCRLAPKDSFAAPHREAGSCMFDLLDLLEYYAVGLYSSGNQVSGTTSHASTVMLGSGVSPLACHRRRLRENSIQTWKVTSSQKSIIMTKSYSCPQRGELEGDMYPNHLSVRPADPRHTQWRRST